jgi:hypothetical protein
LADIRTVLGQQSARISLAKAVKLKCDTSARFVRQGSRGTSSAELAKWEDHGCMRKPAIVLPLRQAHNQHSFTLASATTNHLLEPHMKALWTIATAFAAVFSNALPVRAQEDFSTHNRFIYAPNVFPEERVKLPRVRDVQHSVKSGQVSLPPVSLNSLLPESPESAPPASGTNVSLFGQPRPLPVLNTGCVAPLPPEPFIAHSHRESVSPITMQPRPITFNRNHQHVPCERKIANVSKAHPSASIHGRLQPPNIVHVMSKSYPAELGYSYGSPSGTVSVSGKSQIEVRGRLLNR